VKFVDYFEDEHMLYIIFEHNPGKDLYDLIIENSSEIQTESQISNLIYQILKILQYLHSRNTIHRDIKPENFSVHPTPASPTTPLTLTLIDFSKSIVSPPTFTPTDTDTPQPLSEYTGTPYYIAPEVLAGAYTQQIDIWATGVILYILATHGTPPFQGTTDIEVLTKVYKGNYSIPMELFGDFSPIGKLFLTKLLEKDPKKRISVTEALNNEWFLKFTTKLQN
jgi:calcium-dependent protein kinase